MTYDTGASFRRALEDRLRLQSLQTGMPLVRLRKMVAFDRFLVRLEHEQPGMWVLKGGLALQLRLGQRARTTKDIDLLLTEQVPDVHQSLVRAARFDAGDWFQFEVARPSGRLAFDEVGGARFQVRGLIEGRRFEEFHLDVVWGAALVEPAERLSMPALLAFAHIPASEIPCLSLAQQVAEKVHAYTRPHVSGQGSRVKDLVDLLIIAELNRLDGGALRRAIDLTFGSCGSHDLPDSLPDPPVEWSVPFRRLAEETGQARRTLAEAGEAARRFLDPVLQGGQVGNWNPVAWSWRVRT